MNFDAVGDRLFGQPPAQKRGDLVTPEEITPDTKDPKRWSRTMPEIAAETLADKYVVNRRLVASADLTPDQIESLRAGPRSRRRGREHVVTPDEITPDTKDVRRWGRKATANSLVASAVARISQAMEMALYGEIEPSEWKAAARPGDVARWRKQLIAARRDLDKIIRQLDGEAEA